MTLASRLASHGANPAAGAPELELEHAACPLGCQPGDEPILQGRDLKQGLPGLFTIVRCRCCSLLRTDPRPTPAAMLAYYPDDYSSYWTPPQDDSPERIPRWKRRLRALRRTEQYRLPPAAPGRLLDVGCGPGTFLCEMGATGWRGEGIELSEYAASKARELGFPVRTGAIETAAGPEQPVDLVTAFEVLEHLHAPVLALKKMASWTVQGGWLVASVPNAAAIGFHCFGALWYHLHLPNHLYHFTTHTMKRLLDLSGWELVRVFHHRVLEAECKSAGRWLAAKNRLPWLARELQGYDSRLGRNNLLMLPAASALALVGRTGGMTLWARKAG
ncbi:MAG: class I SAM-dependent methyltransferase [Candidatus Wallbacteria bacterium]|nr:class I SAM-dependent methyltransferase [Candidatus Wallbacteria bacterium]